MNVVFLTIGYLESIRQHSIYADLLREFAKHGHNVYTVSAYERRERKSTEYVNEDGVHMLHVKIGNLTQTNVIEKGISTMTAGSRYKAAIKKFFRDVKFDLVLYTTPPITLLTAVEYIKKSGSAKTYLLLKDIFPQNAIDIGMLSKSGLKGLICKFFRRKEKKLYALSDHIGCMSPANVDFVLKNNPEIPAERVEVCPNSIEIVDKSVDETARKNIRLKYGIPLDKKVFVYGGNLGRPQGIDFLISCIKSQKDNKGAFFLIVGDGTEYGKIEKFYSEYKQSNFKLMKRLPKEDYDTLVGACDVGMIFLDYRFTIPNFPSRLLSYMQAKIPVLACTDPNTDIGKIIVEGGFGWRCESNDTEAFGKCVDAAKKARLDKLGDNAMEYLKENYSAAKAYSIVMQSAAKE